MKNNMITITLISLICIITFMAVTPALSADRKLDYTIVDTGQNRCYNTKTEIHYPKKGQSLYGQDAQYVSNPPSYRDNGDGTITDLNTGLMWQKTPDFNKRVQSDAEKYAKNLKLAGHDDWRLPTIKELFSIADFNGNMHTRTPYIDTRYFDFEYPRATPGMENRPGHRDMDGQYTSSTQYLGTTMFGDKSIFGFNFADGRIKAYPIFSKRYVRCVRGKAYGKNRFLDNRDGTVTDKSTGLTWMKNDSKKPMNWQQALKYAEDLKLAGHDDWRLPNVKELQSIVDYSKAPDARKPSQRGAAIDKIFNLTKAESWFWSGTTHVESNFAYYVCFGRGMSAWVRNGKQVNAHGAGAVRSDPKTGNPSLWKNGLGPQGDEIRIYNYVRCVRGGNVKTETSGPELAPEKLSRTNRPPGMGFNTSNNSFRQGERGQQGQRRQGGQHGKRFVERLDKNGDGKVSRQEFDGPPQHFDHCDKNHDGFLEESEAPPPPPHHRRKQG